uniref:Uncharacterized protein n=1 Tax=Guillardia theta TaxID=55529 RepID=A0A7S4P3T6_GUITH
MLAHQLVDAAISRGKSTVDNLKSKPGYLKWTVERVEQPVLYVADTNLAKAALKAGDHALTIADQTIDKAMNTHAYKSTHAFVKTTYSTKVQPVIEKRIVPATNAVSSGIATTTSTIVNAPAKTYEATMTFADRQVDYFLPEKDQQLDKDLKKSPVGITLKVSRRTGRRVIAVKNRVHKAASWVVDTARPSNVKRQATKTYSNIFSALDGFVDKYLPDDDKIVAKGPIVLTKKVMTRGKKRGLAAARSAMLAVKTSPQTFKRILSDTVKGAKVSVLGLPSISELCRSRLSLTLCFAVEDQQHLHCHLQECEQLPSSTNPTIGRERSDKGLGCCQEHGLCALEISPHSQDQECHRFAI